MGKYYDLVMANVMAKYARKEVNLDLPCTGLDHLSEKERWKKIKETFFGKNLIVITEWGLIDFDPAEKDLVVGGDGLSYEDYLDLQKQSADSIREDFEKTYHDAISASFKGKIERINAKKNKLCFERIFIYGQYSDGEGYFGKESHVWMDYKGFEKYHVGDCLAFDADVYRYLKTGHGKMIDFGLRNPAFICKIEEYELPSDKRLLLQDIDSIICNDLCMFREHCNGFCIADKEWLETMRNIFLNEQ